MHKKLITDLLRHRAKILRCIVLPVPEIFPRVKMIHCRNWIYMSQSATSRMLVLSILLHGEICCKMMTMKQMDYKYASKRRRWCANPNWNKYPPEHGLCWVNLRTAENCSAAEDRWWFVFVFRYVLRGCLQCFDAVGWAAGRASSL